VLSMWKCFVWCEHGKSNEQDVWRIFKSFLNTSWSYLWKDNPKLMHLVTIIEKHLMSWCVVSWRSVS
jgi:hypothetical protein